MRGQIERLLGIHALDIYGLSETIGPGVACESLDSGGLLNVAEDHFYVEAVDETSAPVPDGTPGELVFNTLTKTRMPPLRYRSGDVAALAMPLVADVASDGACTAGTTGGELRRADRAGGQDAAHRGGQSEAARPVDRRRAAAAGNRLNQLFGVSPLTSSDNHFVSLCQLIVLLFATMVGVPKAFDPSEPVWNRDWSFSALAKLVWI
jgi:hypothetical protein